MIDAVIPAEACVNHSLYRCGLVRLLSLVLCVCAGSALGQGTWPDKPLKILVGFPPGTSTDTLTRMVANHIAERLGQPVVIENRPGAGSSSAAEAVVHAAADGYTLLASSTANAINPSLYHLSFDLEKDLRPVGAIAEAPLLLITPPGLGVHTIAQLVALSRSKPDALVYGSSGVGTFSHLNGELFKMVSGAQLTHVPYKGSSQAIADLLSGQIQVLFTPASTAIQHVKAGKAVALAVIGRRRSAELPDVPTMAQVGLGRLDASLWSGLHAPAGTPNAVIDRLNRELQVSLSLPEVRAQIAAQSNDALPGTPEQFAQAIHEDIVKWAHVVQAAAIKPE